MPHHHQVPIGENDFLEVREWHELLRDNPNQNANYGTIYLAFQYEVGMVQN